VVSGWRPGVTLLAIVCYRPERLDVVVGLLGDRMIGWPVRKGLMALRVYAWSREAGRWEVDMAELHARDFG
jgi:hypothetical protein